MVNDFLKLTDTVYRVLEFFPESDPLKNRAKDKALVIMEHLTLLNETSGWVSFHKEKIKSQILEDIDVLLGYLWIGKSQKWLNSANCLIISNEYEKIKKELEPRIEMTLKLPEVEKIEIDSSLTERQEKIIDFLTKNEKAQVMDLQAVLPDVTKRTIRRDLDELLEIGKVTREGDFNEVSYKLKS